MPCRTCAVYEIRCNHAPEYLGAPCFSWGMGMANFLKADVSHLLSRSRDVKNAPLGSLDPTENIGPAWPGVPGVLVWSWSSKRFLLSIFSSTKLRAGNSICRTSTYLESSASSEDVVATIGAWKGCKGSLLRARSDMVMRMFFILGEAKARYR
jgi:hypothetical protein